MAKPVIATLGRGHGGAGGGHRKTGFLLSSNTGCIGWSQYIHQLLDHPDAAEEMGQCRKAPDSDASSA
jgi:hypothetical protein